MAVTQQITIAIDTTQSAKSVGELRKGIKELQGLALQVGEGGKGFKEISNAIAEAKDKVDDLNDATNSLKGTGIEKLNASFGLLKESVGTLDLDKAKTGFNVLGTAMKAVPIFLVIEGIRFLIENFDKLTSAGGLVGDVFTFIKTTIDNVIQGFKDFTDSIGLTSFAANKAAEEAEKRRQEDLKGKIDAAKKTTEIAQQLIKDQEIAEEKAREDAEKAREKDLADQEKFFWRSIELGIQFKEQQRKNDEADRKEKQDKVDAEFEAIQEQSAKEQDAEIKSKLDTANLLKKISADQLATDKAIANAKREIAFSSFALISNIGNLAIQDEKKREQFRKASGLVQIGIDTALALSSALATANSPTPDNVVTGGLAGIAKYITLAATITANALKAKQLLSSAGTSPSFQPSAVPTLSTPSSVGPSQRPSNNMFLTATGGSSSNENQGGGPLMMRAYVTESDITNTQARNARYRAASQL